MTNGSIVAICISGYAALISTGVFIWNVYMALSDKGKIKIGGFFGHLYDGLGSGKKVLYYEFVNSGRKPITIAMFGGIFNRRHIKAGGKNSFIVNTPGINVRLEPGDKHQLMLFDFSSVDKNVKEYIVWDSLGNKHKMSKKLIKQLIKDKFTENDE